MLLMYVSSKTVPEFAIEDDGSKNKMKSCVKNLEIKIQYYRIFFQANDICRIGLQYYQKKIRK